MAFVKYASFADWAGLRDSPPELIKVSSRGLVGHDKMAAVKLAGELFVEKLRQIEDSLSKHCEYAHNISCGATEFFGANRNGDGWRAAILQRDMPTYLKHAKCYRDHINKKDSPHYGRVKIAMFDADRGYGRLLLEYNADKTACDKLGGRLADLEIDALQKKGEFPTSHGTHVGQDECVHCGNLAKKRAEYCLSREEGGSCSLFGCRFGLSKVADDGRVQFVDNPRNIFYDASAIGLVKGAGLGADRIAYATPWNPEMTKTASAVGFDAAELFSGPLYEPRFDLLLPTDLSGYHGQLAKTAAALAAAESQWKTPRDDDPYDHAYAWAAAGDPDEPVKLAALASENPAVLRAAAFRLADAGQLPGPRKFAEARGASADVQEQVAALSQDVISRICGDGHLETLLKTSAFCSPPTGAEDLVDITVEAPGYAIDESSLNGRVKVAAMNEARYHAPRPASQPGLEAAKLAADYAAFKIALAHKFLACHPESVTLIACPRNG